MEKPKKLITPSYLKENLSAKPYRQSHHINVFNEDKDEITVHSWCIDLGSHWMELSNSQGFWIIMVYWSSAFTFTEKSFPMYHVKHTCDLERAIIAIIGEERYNSMIMKTNSHEDFKTDQNEG